jgi:hypothetical protein
MILSGSKSASDQIDVGLSGFNSTLRLLLKTVQNVNCTAETNRINGSVGVGVEVFNQLQYTRTPKSFQGFCIWMLEASWAKSNA